METILNNLNLIVFVGLVALGYVAGSCAERKHYASIIRREREQLKFQVMNAEAYFAEGRVGRAFLVSGSAVISIDYFKRLLGILRNIVGGRVKAYESLACRSRVRMVTPGENQGMRKMTAESI